MKLKKYGTVLYCTVRYCTVLYCTVLFRYVMVCLYKLLFSPASTGDEEKDLEIQSKIRSTIYFSCKCYEFFYRRDNILEKIGD